MTVCDPIENVSPGLLLACMLAMILELSVTLGTVQKTVATELEGSVG